MSLPSPARRVKAFGYVKRARESKAHFGFPWVRPWDYRGKCYMYGKRIQCLSNASQHVYPSVFNRFTVIQPVILKVRHFRTFLAHFGLPGYAPGAIAVNVTWLERGFNACKMPHNVYTHLSSTIILRYSDISVASIARKLRHFHTPPLFSGPTGGDSVGISRRSIHKTRMNWLSCGEESMTICSAVLIQYQRVTDGQTDGRTSSL